MSVSVAGAKDNWLNFHNQIWEDLKQEATKCTVLPSNWQNLWQIFFILFQTLGSILRCVASAVLNVHTENRRTQIIFLLLCALCLVDFVEWHFICLPSSADCNDDTFFLSVCVDCCWCPLSIFDTTLMLFILMDEKDLKNRWCRLQSCEILCSNEVSIE